MWTSNKKLTVANHLHASGQPLSHSSCNWIELVHGSFLAAIPRCVSEWHAFEAQTKCRGVSHSFSVWTSNKKLTVANHLHASGQPLSHSSCNGGDRRRRSLRTHMQYAISSPAKSQTPLKCAKAAMLLPSLASPPCARATKAAHRRRPAVAALPRATRRKTGPRRPDRDDLGHDFARAGPLALASERHWQVSDALGRAGPILCARAR